MLCPLVTRGSHPQALESSQRHPHHLGTRTLSKRPPALSNTQNEHSSQISLSRPVLDGASTAPEKSSLWQPVSTITVTHSANPESPARLMSAPGPGGAVLPRHQPNARLL